MPSSSQLIALASATAKRHSLDPPLVCAVVEQESSWQPWSVRYEPQFREHYVVGLGLAPTEEICRSTSWGLMQVLGQVAREHGFRAEFLAQLCEPSEGLEVGCRILSAKLAAANDVTDGLRSWNGGANPCYVVEVLARVLKYSGSSYSPNAFRNLKCKLK